MMRGRAAINVNCEMWDIENQRLANQGKGLLPDLNLVSLNLSPEGRDYVQEYSNLSRDGLSQVLMVLFQKTKRT